MYKKNIDNKMENEYENLRPDDTIDRESFDALEYAFSNKNITNIAITGNYSSGKSSIIESFINKNFSSKKKIFTLSLAMLSDENKEYDAKEIEKSMIEQLYYSNLVKLRNIEKRFFVCLAILSSTFIFDMLFIFLLPKFNFVMQIDRYIRFGLYCTFIILMSFFMYKLISVIQNCNKVSITAPNIEIDIKNEEKDSNIINKELGLIQKIINNIGIKYIIFEDLDRFNKSIIFDHLRELNIILNNQQKNKIFNKSKIKFIYLIKDDVFKDENRTKFFDFIYPVIPYVTYGTSGEELNKLIKKYGLQEELDERYILDICLFINDFRILKNLLNEYRIYKKDLKIDKLGGKELFSILLYKNIFAEDFVKLQMQEGNLYNQLIIIEEYKKLEIENLENEIIELENQTKLAKQYKIDDENVIEKVWNEIINQIKDYKKIVRFENQHRRYDVKKYDFNKIKEQIELKILLDEKTKILYYNDEGNLVKEDLIIMLERNADTSIIIKVYEEEISRLICYNNSEITTKKAMIIALKRKRNMYDMLNIDELIYFNEKNKKNELVRYLIIHECINSNYEFYIKQFHQGSISKNDAEYLTALKIYKELEYDYKLDNVQNVLKRLNENDFNNRAIVNIDILKGLIQSKSEYYINQICDYFYRWPKLVRFLSYILEYYSEEQQDYFFSIYVKRNDFWTNLSYQLDKNIAEISRILERAFLNLKKDDISDIEIDSDLCNFITNNNLMISNAKYSEVIKSLNVKYKDITLEEFDDDIRNTCIENDCFEINVKNIKYILENRFKVKQNQIETRNFSNICQIKILEKYIKEHIDVYLSNVYFQLENDKRLFENDEKDILYLLNNQIISSQDKEKILKSEKVNIQNLDSVMNIEIKTLLLKNNKNIPNWSDIIKYFNYKKKVDDALIKFINTNNDVLLKRSSEFKECKRNSKFNIEMYKCSNLNNDIYELIVSNTNLILDFSYVKNISKEKIKILIKNNKILVKPENYPNFKKAFGNDLLFLYNKNNINSINGIYINLVKYTLDELNLMLKDEEISKEVEKDLLTDNIHIDLQNSSKKSINLFIDYILSKKINVNFDTADINYLFENISNRKRDELFYHYIDKLEKEEIINIINLYLPQYNSLVSEKKEIYDYTEKLILLIQILIHKGIKIKYKIFDNKILVNNNIESLL